MIKRKLLPVIFALLGFGITQHCIAQSEPWTPEQLIEPSKLSAIINDPVAEKPLIISIGPTGIIKGAIKMGAANIKENLDNLKKYLEKTDRDKDIVLYCGCCPFEHCPNIRPAFSLLNKMKFTKQKLLNLPHNLKMDWINNGYPMNDQ